MGQVIRALVQFEVLLMKKSVVFFIALTFSCFLIPLFLYLGAGNKNNELWIFLHHGQMFFTILLMPLMYSVLYDSEKQKMISSVIMPKLLKGAQYFYCKSCVLWGVVCLFQFVALAMIGVVQWTTHSKAPFLILLQLTAAGVATMGYSVQITVILNLVLRKQLYVNIVMLVYLLISITINFPYISIWFNPDWIISNFFTQSFSFGRVFLFLLIWVLMKVSNHLWMARVQG
ncbi:ABC transporter permease [Paenibacillus sp. Mc5Re-14]|uniref:ABC transporter permease n=1 Tax=Paenibacillus sp. Mc5Re-14 TaxID=1030529 RepID=UPI000A9B0D78|nr:ABC transporter permease [Paenibacillus sp. Mc5Re-14]